MTTSSGQVAGATQQAAGQTASTAKDEAGQVGQTAASAASDVAGTAKQQAGQVAGEAVNQLKSLTDEARTQATQQASGATEKLSTTVRSLAGELRDLSQGKADSSGTVAGLAQQLADKGEQIAEHISSQGPGGLVQDLRSFAARKPGTFLLGALAAGVLTGRVVKGATADSGGSGGTGTPAGTAGALGTADTGYVTTYPAEPDLAVVAVPPSSTTYLDDATGLTDGTGTVGPVSGDERLLEERGGSPYEPGTGPR